MTPIILSACLVIGVADGDSAKIKCRDRPAMSVRIKGIDAPEIAHPALHIAEQPGGASAKEALSIYCLGQKATVRVYGTDRYRRTLADVDCAGVDAARAMVLAGRAWPYMAGHDSPLWPLMTLAQTRGVGVWAEPGAVKPSEWRKRRTP